MASAAVIAALPPEIELALGYAPAGFKAPFATLLRLDRRFGAMVASATEMQLARIRLAWWRDEIEAAPETEAVAADPDLAEVQALLRRRDVTAGQMTRIVEGWSALLDDMPLPEAALQDYAHSRGGGLVRAAAALTGSSAPDSAGSAFALVDFARNCSNQTSRESAVAIAIDLPAEALPRALRPFALLDNWARRDARRLRDGLPPLSLRRRAFWALTFGVTGPRL